jgi:hypothetical protein
MPSKPRRPSHATVVAYLALFVALGGTTYAALRLAPHSVGGRELKPHSVTGRHIRDRSITGADIKGGSLTLGHLAGTVHHLSLAQAKALAGTSRVTGTTARAQGTLSLVMTTNVGPVVSDPNSYSAANCPAGQVLIGGAANTDPNGESVGASLDYPDQEADASIVVDPFGGGPLDAWVQAVAYCAQISGQ